MIKRKSIVAALQIGKESAVFYSFTKDKNVSIFNIPFECSPNKMKTSTKIILNRDRNIVAFGKSTSEYYSKHIDHSPTDYPLFSNFEMALYYNSKDQVVQSKNSYQTATIKELYREIFKYLKEVLFTKIFSTFFKENENDIQWVMVVPTICSEENKQLLRECADSAGLGSKYDKGI